MLTNMIIKFVATQEFICSIPSFLRKIVQNNRFFVLSIYKKIISSHFLNKKTDMQKKFKFEKEIQEAREDVTHGKVHEFEKICQEAGL